MAINKFIPAIRGRRSWVPVLGLAAGVSLAACGASDPTTTTPLSTSTHAATPSSMALRAVTEQPPTSQPTPSVELPSPSPVHSPTAQSSATPQPSPTSVPSPTPDAVATLLAGEMPRVHSTLLSPDGRYRAEVIIYGCNLGEEGDAYEIVRVIDTTSGQEHFIDDQYHLCMGSGGSGLDVLFWDPGNRFVYYTPSRDGGPDGGCEGSGRPMFRADVSDWSVTNMGGPVESPEGGVFVSWRDGDLAIWAIDGREFGRLRPLPDYPILGMPAWSPDGDALAYFQLSMSLCAGAGDILTAIVVVDPETLEEEVVYEGDSVPIFDLVWLDGEQLLLQGFDSSWILDLRSGTLSDGPD